MTEVKKIFCQRLTELRIKAGLTQKQLADMCSKRQTAISKWEKCENEPSLDDIYQLASIFKCSIDHLFGMEFQSPAALPSWLVPLYPKLVKLRAPAREAIKALLRGFDEGD